MSPAASFQPGLMLQPFVVSQLVGSLIEEIVDGSEVSASEFAVTSSLAILVTATPTELARKLGLSPTTLSAMLKRLTQKGQLRRTRHPDDGRSSVLELTRAGKSTNARNVKRFARGDGSGSGRTSGSRPTRCWSRCADSRTPSAPPSPSASDPARTKKTAPSAPFSFRGGEVGSSAIGSSPPGL